MTDIKKATENAIAIFHQLTVDGRVNHKALRDELQRRNGGRPLTKPQQRTLAQMVKAYEAAL